MNLRQELDTVDRQIKFYADIIAKSKRQLITLLADDYYETMLFIELQHNINSLQDSIEELKKLKTQLINNSVD